MAELGWIIHEKSKLKLGLNLEKFSEREDYDYHGREVGWAIQKNIGKGISCIKTNLTYE